MSALRTAELSIFAISIPKGAIMSITPRIDYSQGNDISIPKGAIMRFEHGAYACAIGISIPKGAIMRAHATINQQAVINFNSKRCDYEQTPTKYLRKDYHFNSKRCDYESAKND